MPELDLQVERNRAQPRPFRWSPKQVLLAGYAGRDQAAVLAHIEELASLGVAPPAHIPTFFEVSPADVTVSNLISVHGAETSGEVETYLIFADGRTLVGVASDHTDRAIEIYDVAESKRACPKVLSSRVWLLDDVSDHWDTLRIRSWVTKDGKRELYQDATLAALLTPSAIIDALDRSIESLVDGLLLCGTVPTLAGYIYSNRFDVELVDEALGRTLRCGYDVAIEPKGLIRGT